MNASYKAKYARKPLARSPMRNQVLCILGVFIFACMILIGMGYIQSETFNSVRAFVRGEGLWGKAQKDATFYLEEYAVSRSPKYYEKFKHALDVNLGDKQARLALSQAKPDIKAAKEGFLKGGNHPKDIDSMITFFIRFENFYYMQKAIDVWERGDKKIADLILLGEKIHQCIQNDKKDCRDSLIINLEILNDELNEIAIEFSLVLSEGARWIKSTFMSISIVVILLLSLLIYFVSRKIISDLDKNEQELMTSEDRFYSLYNADVIGMMDWHIDGRILDANQAFLNMLGYTKNEFDKNGLNWRKITPKKFAALDEHAAQEIAQQGYCKAYEKSFTHKDGHHIPVSIGSAILQGIDDRGICFVIDQTLQKDSETQLRLSATVFDSSSDGMMIMDQYKHVVAVNSAFCQLTGMTESELIGATPPLLMSNEMPDGFYEHISSTLMDQGVWKGDVSIPTKQGDKKTLHLNINAVRDNNYQIRHYVANVSDITERKVMEEQLKTLAHFDFLTGLANRSLYNDRLSQSISRAKRYNSTCAILFFDLDKFKPVNDQFGHEMGDTLLQELAKRVSKQTRTNDTFARIGGDEFVIILEDVNEYKHVSKFAKKLIKTISMPFDINNHALKIGCSIGISLYPEDGDDVITLTRNADIAMYAAKSSGRNCYYFFNQKYNDKHTDCD